MTGTALTEATEFMKIYQRPIVDVPTHRQMVRADQNDQIFKTKDGKVGRGDGGYRRLPRQGRADPGRNRSVEVSEMISEELKRQGIHRVLNASPSTPSERAIIAEAGQARRSSPPTWPAAASTLSSAATRSSRRSTS